MACCCSCVIVWLLTVATPDDWSLPCCWTTCPVDVSAAALPLLLVSRLLLYCLAYGDGATAILAWRIVLPILVEYLYTWKTITNVTKCFDFYMYTFFYNIIILTIIVQTWHVCKICNNLMKVYCKRVCKICNNLLKVYCKRVCKRTTGLLHRSPPPFSFLTVT